jgi:UDP-2-acetamido-3-amino-2,3-dideoxy-glucuronate N-acetyltransferase
MAAQFHPTAEVSSKAKIGEGTRIWHHSQVREDVEIGQNSILGKNVYVDFGVKIGSGVKLQNNVSVYHGVTIGDDVFVGPGVCFTNDLYPRARIWDEGRVVKTLIKDGVSIGANSTIVCGHTIGENAMIGAGSVVTKDIPAHALAYGNPARVVGYVCVCGRKLDKKGKAHKCPECKKEYRL